MVKNQPANAGDIRDRGSIPVSGRYPGGGHGHSLQYSCLENPMDRGAWWATVHRVAKSQTQLKRLSLHTHTCAFYKELSQYNGIDRLTYYANMNQKNMEWLH